MFDDVEYFSSKELFEKEKGLFKGCSRIGIRGIIEVRNIPESDYVFVCPPTKTQKTFRSSNANNKKGLLLISVDWVMRNITSIKVPEYRETPPSISLADHEKFRHDNGSIIEIDCCGWREERKVWFKVKDVSLGFGMPHLKQTLLNTDYGYKREVHYDTFSSPRGNETLPHPEQSRSLFLTYKGLMKVLHSSRTGCADKFIDWATNVVFVAQMGTHEQRQHLVTEISGPTSTNVKRVMNCSTTGTPCVYLFQLGSVKTLKGTDFFKDSLDHFPQTSCVYKFGLTNDLKRRTYEHERTFGSIEGVSLLLEKYSYVDPQFLVRAENELSAHFKKTNTRLVLERTKELVVLSSQQKNVVNDLYTDIAKKHGGILSDIVERLTKTEHEKEVQQLTHKNEMLTMTHQLEIQSLLHAKEIDRLNHEIELLNQHLDHLKI